MDNLTIDLGPETEVEPGDEAVLIGAQGEEAILAEEVAARLGDDQLRGHLRDLGPGAAARRHERWPTRLARRAAGRRRRGGRWRTPRASGSSAARCATPPSGARSPTSTSPSPATPARRRGRSRRELGEHAFELSAEFGTWRVVARGPRLAGRRRRRCAATASRPTSAARDFTIGAVAVPLAGGEPIDPFGGLADLERGVLRAVGERSFARRPAAAAARGAPRRRARPARSTPAPSRWPAPPPPAPPSPPASASWPSCGSCSAAPTRCAASPCSTSSALTAVVLPELEALRGVEQGPNHHLDVHGHTLAVLEHTLEVEADLERFAGERAAEVAALLAEPLADEMSRGTALRFGALFHDIGKPATRAERDGFVGFRGHDQVGAEIVGEICGRLRASRRLTQHLQGADAAPPAARLPDPRGAAAAAAGPRVPAGDRTGRRRRHPAHRRRPALRPRRRAAGQPGDGRGPPRRWPGR